MKRFTEIVCDMYSNRIKESMKTVVVRPGNLYGPFDKFDWEKSKVIPAIMRRAIEKHNPFEVWGDGMDLKDFLYIDDLVDGLILAMEKLEEFEPINIASGVPVTIRDVLSEILKSADYEDADVQYDSSKPTMIPKRMIDISLAKEKLGFKPKVSLEDGIQRTVDWYRDFYKNSIPENSQ
jgi:GDP-L-fucose synthase